MAAIRLPVMASAKMNWRKWNRDEIKAAELHPGIPAAASSGIVKYPDHPNIQVMMIAALPREALRASRIHAGS